MNNPDDSEAIAGTGANFNTWLLDPDTMGQYESDLEDAID